ncbi:MAG TPA: hypothetical protein VFS21_07990 [Roseiflexaceae bacterium]|nr:hypothetical protein [Roseiflexaceae bacterium]
MDEQCLFVDHVRKRPGMYIGPLHLFPYEAAQIWIQTAPLASPDHSCTRVELTVRPDRSLVLSSDGRYPEIDAPALPAALTEFASGGRVHFWDAQTLTAVLNALASHLTLELFTGERVCVQEFRHGRPLGPVRDAGPTERLGRRITFAPDETLLAYPAGFATAPLLTMLRVCAALHAGLTAALRDERDGSLVELCYPQGLRDYLLELTGEQPGAVLLHASGAAAGVALRWGCGEDTTVESYVNGRLTEDGGSHVTGMWRGLARAVDRHARARRIFNDSIPPLRARDLPRGVAAVVSVDCASPHYSGALRRRLCDSSVEHAVCRLLEQQLTDQLLAHAHLFDAWAHGYAHQIQARASA